jgi:NADH-quinone oxidoreductase subunit G
VAGVPELGAIGRGEDMEITTYLEHAMKSELQGNVIDLCPVGALTARPYAFQARPWELVKTESIDAMDAVGSNIRVDTRGREVLRILPRTHEDVNEEWISDKTRFVWDGLRVQRLDQPYLRENGRLRAAGWQEAFGAIAARVKAAGAARTGAILGDLVSTEEAFAIKDLFSRLNVENVDCRQDGAALDPALGRASYLLNSTIAGIEQADALLIVGSDPRREAAVLNARIRKRWLRGNFPVGLVGGRADLTYDAQHLGGGPETLAEIASGRHPFSNVLKKAERPMLILGQGALARPDGAAVLSLAAKVAAETRMLLDEWNGFSVLHTAAARVGALDVGAVPGKGGLDTAGMLAPGALDVLFLFGADEVEAPPGAFVVYLGTHGDRGAHRADVILPGSAYTEKTGIYVNTEGRPQMANRAAFPPGEAREDWAILRAMSEPLGAKLPYDSLAQLRGALFATHPHLAAIDRIEPADPEDLRKLAERGGTPDKTPFRSAVTDFYLTNAIARASAVMAECSALAAGKIPDAAE